MDDRFDIQRKSSGYNVPYKHSIMVCRVKVQKEGHFGGLIGCNVAVPILLAKDCSSSKYK